MSDKQSKSVETSINERMDIDHRRVEKFLTLANIGDITAIYRGKPLWLTKEPNEIKEIITDFAIEQPAYREAELSFIGKLIHEYIHNYYLVKENTKKKPDIAFLENSVRICIKELYSLTAAHKSAGLLGELLKWIFQLLTEISKQNRGRPSTIGCKTTEELSSKFEQCPIISEVLGFLRHVLKLFLESSLDDAVAILMDASKFGEFFDWVWLYLARTFPNDCVGPLMRKSAEAFLDYCSTMTTHQGNQSGIQQFQSEYHARLRSICVFFITLAQRRNSELRMSIKRILEKFFDDEDIIPMIFYIKLCISPEIPNSFTFLFVIADDLHQFISSQNIVKLLSLSKHQFLNYAIPPTANILSFIRMALAIRNLDNLNLNLLLLENLLLILKNAEFARSGLSNVLVNGVKSLLSDLFTNFINAMHIDPLFKSIALKDLPILNKYVKNITEQRQAINTALMMKDIAEQDFQIKDVAHGYFKLLHTICIVSGEETCSQILARILYMVTDVKELTVFVSLASSIAMFYPNITTLAVEHLLENHSNFMIESKETNNVRFVKNLLLLNEWHKIPDPTNMVKQIGLCLLDLSGFFQEHLLDFILMYLDNSKKLDAKSYEELDFVFTLMKSFAPKATLSPQMCHRILAQFSGALIALLKLVNKDHFGEVYDGIDSIYKCFDLTTDFIRVQTGTNFTPKRHFLSIFVDEIFSSFRLTPEPIPPPPVPHDDQGLDVHSFMKQFKTMEFNKRAAAMAHSGVFKKPRLMRPDSNSSVDLFKRAILMDLFDKLCILEEKQDETVVYDISFCRDLAQLICENACGDALTNTVKWDEWEVEKENISRYIEVSKKVYENPIIYDYLLLLTDIPYPFILVLSPIIKSLLASSLMYFESTPLKEGKPLQSEVEKIDLLFALLVKSGIAPTILEVAYEMICSVSNHEVYAILWDLWNFLCLLIPNPNEITLINSQIEQLNVTPVQPPTGEKSFLVSTMVLVIQRNIVKLGHLLPLIIDKESWTSDENSNEWPIDRLLPVISAPENIKR